jgi:superfamily II DNA or RNA helicase
MVETATVKSLIADGYLVPTRVYAPSTPVDLSDVAYDRKRRDFAPRGLAKRMGRRRLVGDAIEHWRRHAWGKRTFVYTVSRAHAASVRKQFVESGIGAEVIDGTTPKRRRAELLAACESRSLPVLVNVAVLIEGVDLPALECEVILRPTLSPTLHYQMVGRGLRPASRKSYCLYLDHADNFRRHGFPEDAHDWTAMQNALKGQSPTRKIKDSKARTCPGCRALIPVGERACPHCGYAYGEIIPETMPGRLARLKVWFR